MVPAEGFGGASYCGFGSVLSGFSIVYFPDCYSFAAFSNA
jgi:hypothetical protein